MLLVLLVLLLLLDDPSTLDMDDERNMAVFDEDEEGR